MTASSEINPTFADLSALIEYCTVYYDEHHYASRVIDEFSAADGKIVVSGKALKQLNTGMSERERLWEFLLEKAREYQKDSSLSATQFRSEVLDYTSLEQAGFDFDESTLPDIKSLRNLLNNQGLDGFKTEIDDARIQAKIQRKELEVAKRLKKYSRGSSRTPWLKQASVDQYTSCEAQTESMMDFGYWRRENTGKLVIGSMCKAAKNKDEVTDVLSDIANTNPDVLTPKEAFERTSIFS